MFTKKCYYIVWVIMISTLLLHFSGGYTYAPGLIKMLFSFSLWICLLIFPFRIVRHNDFDKIPNVILKGLLLFTLIAVLTSVFDNSSTAVGNKWLTLFGNPECMFMMLAPCFVCLASIDSSLGTLLKSWKFYIAVGTLGALNQTFIPVSVLWISAVFYPYVDRKYRFLVLLSIVFAIYAAFFAESTSRTTIILILFVLASYFSVYILNSPSIVKQCCYVLIAISTIYAILTLVEPDFSVFQIILDLLMQNTGDQDLSTDTRTFLFWELAEDLTKNNSWIFGKGAYSNYFSLYFWNSTSGEGDHYYRLTCEVTFLQCLLRGGICYTICYFSLIAYAVYNAFTKSRNKMLKSIAIIATGWYAIACMSYLNGCDYKHLGFFLLLGCCLSNKWLNYTDEDIKRMLS